MPQGEIERITARGLPKPTVPLSHGVLAGDLLHISGMVPRKPDGEIIEDDIRTATLQCLDNLLAVLRSVGGKKADVVKISVFLDTFDDYAGMNVVFEEFFEGTYPARTTVEAGRLGIGQIEIDGIAFLGNRASPVAGGQ